MSMGIIKNGGYDKVAGYSESGELVIGASTIRKGTASITWSSGQSHAIANVTFDTPMPDADYIISVHNQGLPNGFECSQWTITNKTKNGFTVEFWMIPGNTGAPTQGSVSWTAFKLFTKEGLEDLENDVADLKKKDTTKAVATATIVNSKAHSDSFIWVNRNGNVVQVAAKFAWNPGVQVSFLETWATGLPKPIHMLWPSAIAFAGRAGNPALPLQFTVNGELKLDNGWPEYLAEYPDSRCFDAYATFTYITDDPF